MGIKQRSRRTRAAASKNSSNRGSYYSDEIYIPKKAGKSPGHPTVILPAKYSVPISDEGVRDPDSSFYLFKTVRAKVNAGGKAQYRSDCVPGRWPTPDDPDYPTDDPRVFSPEEGKKDTLWDHLSNSGDKRISWSMTRAFNVIDLRTHHEIPKVDKDGKEKTTKAGETIMARYPCDGRGCKHCDEEYEKSDGRRGYTSVGSGHFLNLGTIEEELEDNCRSCQEGTVSRVALVCPESGDILIDLEEDQSSDDQVEHWLEQGMYSASANKGKGRKVYPDEMVECDKCDQGARADIHDVVLFLRKTGEGTNSAISVKSKSGPGWMWLCEFELSNGEPLILDWKVVHDEEADTFSNEYEWNEGFVANGWIEPVNFNKVRRVGVPAMKNEWVAEFLGVDLPQEFDEGSGANRRSRRGSDDDDKDDSKDDDSGRSSRRSSSRSGGDSRRRSSSRR